jgi:hypothetical protein
MPARTLQPSVLKAQLAGLAEHLREVYSPVVAFQANGWEGPSTMDVDSRTWHVKACRSVLELREALANRGDSPLVILTSVEHSALLPDVTARLVKRRLFQVDAWEPVLRAFGAQRIDARLSNHAWLADVLLEGTPAEGYPRVASGTLDVTTAWRWAAGALVGIDAAAPDLRSLLEWTLEGAVLARWAAVPGERSAQLSRWLLDVIGPPAELPLALLKSGNGKDAVPIGLACGVLFSGEGEPSGVLGAAAVRLEQWTGGLTVSAARGIALAREAERLLATLQASGGDRAPMLAARAEEILRSLGAEAEAWRSRWIPAGFTQRLNRFADALAEVVRGEDPLPALSRALQALHALRDHAAAANDEERAARAEHALRLARYQQAGAPESAASFSDAVAAYARDHAFADIARYALYASEPHPKLAAAVADIAERVAARREAFTFQFADLAKGWFEAPAESAGLVPVERLLTSVVAPLAVHGPVLLLVIDGMSAATAESLGESIARRGWVQVVPADAPERLAALPALPSVTEVCRTSLFSGVLKTGTASDERAGFVIHPALVALSHPDLPPIVFHKASLGAAAELELGVASAIANQEQRIVAAVINAIDDHLLKDDLVRPKWTTEYVPVIGALCDAARVAGRRLVITADHGHVLDLKLTERVAGGGSDRYRTDPTPPRPGEVVVTGGRVLTQDGRVVVAASERLRYCGRKNGYHGGISPQEMVVPLLLFAAEGRVPTGYREVFPARPDWWDLDAPLRAVPQPTAPAAKTGMPLFDVPAERRLVVARTTDPWWLEAMLRSDVLAAQRRRATRAALADERLRALLSAMVARGGRMTLSGLAERLGIPAGRISSTIAAASQLLNFDGYQVLFIDGDDVVLEEALLVTQFEVGRSDAEGR